MKIIHLSDLHLGKRVNEFSMLDDQEYILKEIIGIIDAEKPQVVIIAGDVYDKSVPSAEAVELFDEFLVKLAKREMKVFVISGNHDSPERIAFGGRLMDASGVYMSQVFGGNISPITLSDEYGGVNFYMLPFVKPVHVRKAYPDDVIDSYTDAIKTVVQHMGINTDERNVLIAHQFVTGAKQSESEEITIGGLDNVDANAFEGFDYVALGHIHGPQNIGTERIRYCGTPLKYSFSEANHEKSVSVITLGMKGQFELKTVLLKPMHDMREIRGTYNELTSKTFYEGTFTDDYLHITLTDEDDEPDAARKLRLIYPNLMKMDYDNKRTRTLNIIDADAEAEKKSPLELLKEFFEKQNGSSLKDIQADYSLKLIEKIWEDKK